MCTCRVYGTCAHTPFFFAAAFLAIQKWHTPPFKEIETETLNKTFLENISFFFKSSSLASSLLRVHTYECLVSCARVRGRVYDARMSRARRAFCEGPR